MANKYIRFGAAGTGTGASWTNAYASLAAARTAGFTRGNTYYIAGSSSNYALAAALTFGTGVSSTSVITLKKANAADNGGEGDYDPTYASQVACITKDFEGGVIEVDKGYITIDGVTGSAQSGYGIKIWNTSTNENSRGVEIDAGVTNLELLHCEVRGASDQGPNATIGIYANTSGDNTKLIHINYCWVHQTTTNGIQITNVVGTNHTSDYALLIENTVVSETGRCTDADKHGQGMQFGGGSNFKFVTVRNCFFQNVVGSAMIAMLGGASNIAHSDIRIYNNDFTQGDIITYYGLSPGPIWHEAIKSYTNITLDRLYIYNNNFYNIRGVLPSDGTASGLGQIVIEIITSAVELKNNNWENCQFTSNHSVGITQLNNAYYNCTGGASVPSGTPGQISTSVTTFLNGAAANFSLASTGYAVHAGVDLSAIFSDDGRTVPWDTGSHIYSASTTAFRLRSSRRRGGKAITVNL